MERHAALFASSRYADFFRCMPTTFTLPREYAAFETAFEHASSPVQASRKCHLAVQVWRSLECLSGCAVCIKLLHPYSLRDLQQTGLAQPVHEACMLMEPMAVLRTAQVANKTM
jgi:hypothetical protein